MDITIIGDEIFANGNKVATIEATTASLVGDFKEWINDQNGNQPLETEISDLEVSNDKLQMRPTRLKKITTICLMS